MIKVRASATALLLVLLTGVAPLTASAPLSASAASNTKVAPSSTSTNLNYVKVQSMNVKMVFDGVNLIPPAGQIVFIHNNTTYVPLRFMSYALKKTVVWDAKNLKVTVNDPSSSELVVIKEYLMNVTSNKDTFISKNLTLTDVIAKFDFNGNIKVLPTGQSSYMLNGTLYVPLRFLSESVGNEIKWDQKTKTITATSKAYQETINEGELAGEDQQDSTVNSSSNGNSGAASAKVSYEEITRTTEAKLNALKAESQSTLMSIAFEYLAAEDAASKTNIKNKGLEQLASFTAKFNSVIADAENKLKANGYSTDIINQYRATFEAELEAGRNIAEGMSN